MNMVITFAVATPMVFPPLTKIRINFTGMDFSAKSPQAKDSEKSSPAREDTTQVASASNKNEGDDDDKGSKVSDESKGDKSPICSDSKSETNKQDAEIVFTEEMKRLKPRLVGKKLTICPPKQLGREESGLCVIC
jgi:hypothetical protein